jgi:hypothetical protein
MDALVQLPTLKNWTLFVHTLELLVENTVGNFTNIIVLRGMETLQSRWYNPHAKQTTPGKTNLRRRLSKEREKLVFYFHLVGGIVGKCEQKKSPSSCSAQSTTGVFLHPFFPLLLSLNSLELPGLDCQSVNIVFVWDFCQGVLSCIAIEAHGVWFSLSSTDDVFSSQTSYSCYLSVPAFYLYIANGPDRL